MASSRTSTGSGGYCCGFHHCDVYPNANDIFYGYLENRLHQGNKSKEHDYLSNQFVLLKKYVVSPLRDAINEFQRNPDRPVIIASEVRIYTKVKFINLTLSHDQLGVVLQLQESNVQQPLKFDLSKRFMFGSLLCFTNSNFQTMFFGKVIERSTNLLQKGQIIVQFEPGQGNYVFSQPYVVAECSDYFEPHYHVLKALQNIDESQFPMKKYILDLYFTSGPVLPIETIGALDDSQRRAFDAALSEQFVVIQGLPGTGKTFLGLKIAKPFIENNVGPILVVSSTNHTLDQFLEGLQDATNRIVRVGGETNNKNMEKFSLREHRRSRFDSEFNVCKDKLCILLNQMNFYSDVLKDIDCNSVVINVKKFREINLNISSSWFQTASDFEITEWLFGSEPISDRINKMKQYPLKQGRISYLVGKFGEVLYNRTRKERKLDDSIRVKKNTDHHLSSVEKFELEINKIRCIETATAADKKSELGAKRLWLEDRLDYLQLRFKEYENVKVRKKPEHCNLQNPHLMSADDRWQLYFYWVENVKEQCKMRLVNLQPKYVTLQKQYNKLKQNFDLNIMKEMLVVGMTITAAACFQTTIKKLKSRVVIVEDATKVVDAYLIVSLTSHCRHLILIGDHQQLRRYRNLGVTLFERMIQKNLQCHILNVQHRMRPEIATLTVRTNQHLVHSFPPIAGIVSNLYFIDHRFEEEENDWGKLNRYEATFLIALARYLIQNGYKSEDITILTAYYGQKIILCKEQSKYLNLLGGVQIKLLDEYQGEENKIVLLSLVRNNKNEKIGILKCENLVRMALSRAKEGFYMMGNMDLLCQSSDVWSEIKTVLQLQGNLGRSLLLRCQVHSDQETAITLPEDFIKVAEGGCSKVCNTQLTCGHFCKMTCHVLDRNHENFKCKAKCARTLCGKNHLCSDLCYEECKPCSITMTIILLCGHTHKLSCHVNVVTFKCTTPMEAKLPCGHTVATKPCYQSIDTYKCPFPCDAIMKPCGHACLKTCHFKGDPCHIKYKCGKSCEKQCGRILPCNHVCKKKYYEPCGDCDVVVMKEVDICKHQISIKCCETAYRRLCVEKCPLLLRCGHECQKRCNETCTVVCKKLVDNTNRAACGHSFKIECHMRQKSLRGDSFEVLKFCDSPCRATLSCTHRCSGNCGECAQGRVHKACTEKCEATLVCGHPCLVDCGKACQPCKQQCSYKCQHSACKKQCGESCTKCEEKCSRKCSHTECAAQCGDVCTVQPCKRWCQKKLSCGHDCVGFCGDPCPHLCRKCNYEELTEIFFGDENDKYARFVVLDECKHVVESSGMDKYLEGSEEDLAQIAPKCCPRCKTILTSTRRYSDNIKKSLSNLIKVKDKYVGTDSDNQTRWTDLTNKIMILKQEKKLMSASIFDTTLKKLENAIISKTKNTIPLYTIYLAKLQIIENIVTVFKKSDLWSEKLVECMDFLFAVLTRNDKGLSIQETADFERELKRFYFLLQISEIETTKGLSKLKRPDQFQNVFEETNAILLSPTAFTETEETSVVEYVDYMKTQLNVEVTEYEFQKVVKPISMRTGNWFKCPNGHIYAIGECDAAMETSKCADCGADIGGTSHALLLNDSDSEEVDGSTFTADC